MTSVQLNDHMIADYRNKKHLFDQMERYYKGNHDIKEKYKKFQNRSNKIITDNFINTFINEEVQYSIGNPLSFVSMSGDKDIIDKIYTNTFHWDDNHNQELMRTLEIFGTAYILNYIDAKGRFSERILNPSNAICFTDDDGVPVRFMHFYKKKYDENEYRDIYYNDGKIEIYRGNTKIQTKSHPFKGIPVSVCALKNIEDTIFFKIKELQDAYNCILSDQCNTISDYRNAYLVISGVKVDEESEKKLQTHGLVNLPTTNSSAKWLVKDMPDTYIENHLDRLRMAMYESTNHIDGTEKLQSNTSGAALRNRLIFLEQRCNMMLSVVINSVYERIERLFEYLEIKGLKYDIADIKIVASPFIPYDETAIIQSMVQLGIGTNISRETALSRISYIENPIQELEKIKAENANFKMIELDKIGNGGDDDE